MLEVINNSGTVVGHVSYDGFGRVLASTGSVQLAFGYTGKMLDGATGLQWNLHRWYDASVGRWVSEDPNGFAGGVNLGRYVDGRTISEIDPNGTKIFSKCKISTYLGQYASGRGERSHGGYLYEHISGKKGGDSLRTEIVTKMIMSNEVFRVSGGDAATCLSNIEKNVESRAKIVELAHAKQYGFGAGKEYFENHTANKVDVATDPLKYYESLNNGGTTIACQMATTYTFYAGIGTWKSNFATRGLRDAKDVVPGDWGYIENLSVIGEQNPNWKEGLEGENVIYVGDNNFWGHFSAGVIEQRWQQWFEDIRKWTGIDGTKGRPIMHRNVKYSTLGLE